MEQQVSNFFEIIKYAIRCKQPELLPKLQGNVEWEMLAQMADAHKLFPLFHEVAYKFPEYSEKSYYQKYTTYSMYLIAQQSQKTDAFLQLYRKFLERGIQPIVMKGIVCRQLYGQYAEYRLSKDEDILVKQDEFFAVKDIMENQGFVCTQPDVTEAQLEKLQEVAFYEEKTGFLIEVHMNIMGHDNDMYTKMGEPFEDVFENIQIQEICGVPVAIMNHTKNFIFLVLHALKHFALSGIGMRQMLDIGLYQETFESDIDWVQVKQILEECSALGFLGDLQSISTRYLGVVLKNKFQSVKPDVLLQDIIADGVFGQHASADEVAMSITLSTAGYQSKGIMKWIRAAFPSKNRMIEVAPYLADKPWMVPVEWVKRWGRFVAKTKEYEGNLLLESVKKSEKRKRLLKMYGH